MLLYTRMWGLFRWSLPIIHLDTYMEDSFPFFLKSFFFFRLFFLTLVILLSSNWGCVSGVYPFQECLTLPWTKNSYPTKCVEVLHLVKSFFYGCEIWTLKIEMMYRLGVWDVSPRNNFSHTLDRTNGQRGDIATVAQGSRIYCSR